MENERETLVQFLYDLDPDKQMWDGESMTLDQARLRNEYHVEVAEERTDAILNSGWLRMHDRAVAANAIREAARAMPVWGAKGEPRTYDPSDGEDVVDFLMEHANEIDQPRELKSRRPNRGEINVKRY